MQFNVMPRTIVTLNMNKRLQSSKRPPPAPLPQSSHLDHPGTQFSCFQPISTVDAVVAVRRLSDKTSAVDTLSVNLLKQLVDVVDVMF